jgi:hypothetical protein|tara:strand:- start:1413 stop:1580 length:168 start_codon:yes stop_codon:yes gene_type:complete
MCNKKITLSIEINKFVTEKNQFPPPEGGIDGIWRGKLCEYVYEPNTDNSSLQPGV